MSHRPFKDRIYAQFARVGNALANDRRLELLDLLAQGPRHVDALAAEMQIPIANVSQHLQVLRNARLVESERQGTKIVYQLADETVLHLWLSLRSVAESRLAEVGQIVRQFAVDGADDSTMDRDELQRRSEEGSILVLDVRPALEYASGHLPGAVSIPIGELPHRVEELPRDMTIVTYCRGSYCLFADEAVAYLHQQGFDARRLEVGWPEWQAEGRPVQSPPV